MKGEGHYAVGGPKGLFNAIAMVNVDVDVENSRVVEEQLEDCENDIVDVAKPRSFRFLRVVEATRPVYGYLRLTRCKFPGSVKGGAGVEAAVFK